MMPATERQEPSSEYLASTPTVNWHDARVRALAGEIAGDRTAPREIARRCFEWVRDRIQHSSDFGRRTVTCSASDVLEHGTGFCYAKSHLLGALLRASNIPAGFCYQRLSVAETGPPFCLHGFNAVWLADFGWYRVDARGNRPGVRAEFTPPVERLAFAVRPPEEFELPGVFAAPLPIVVEALTRFECVQDLVVNLPDIDSISHVERFIT